MTCLHPAHADNKEIIFRTMVQCRDFALAWADNFILFIAVTCASSMGFVAKHVLNKPYFPAH